MVAAVVVVDIVALFFITHRRYKISRTVHSVQSNAINTQNIKSSYETSPLGWRHSSGIRMLGLRPADFSWPAPYLWLTGDYHVGKLSANAQSTQPSIPLESVNE